MCGCVWFMNMDPLGYRPSRQVASVMVRDTSPLFSYVLNQRHAQYQCVAMCGPFMLILRGIGHHACQLVSWSKKKLHDFLIFLAGGGGVVSECGYLGVVDVDLWEYRPSHQLMSLSDTFLPNFFMFLSGGARDISLWLLVGHRCGSFGVSAIMLASVKVRDTLFQLSYVLRKGQPCIIVWLFVGHGCGSKGVSPITLASQYNGSRHGSNIFLCSYLGALLVSLCVYLWVNDVDHCGYQH